MTEGTRTMDHEATCETCGEATVLSRLLQEHVHTDDDADYSPVFGYHTANTPWTHPRGIGAK